MPQPRSTTYRSAGLSQGGPAQYIGNAFVYVLASRIDPNLCKIGKGNPAARCDHWNVNSPHGGILNNNLSVFAVYSFNTEAEALEYESQAHAIYSFVNLNPNAAGGEQEFFSVPPQQARAALDLLHEHYTERQAAAEFIATTARNAQTVTAAANARIEQAERVAASNLGRLLAQAREDGYNNAPMVIAQREAAERAQLEALERAQREAAERAAQEAIERTNRGLREAAERAEAARRAEASQRERGRLIEEGRIKAAEREQRNAAAKEKAQLEKAKRDEGRKSFKRNVLWPILTLGLASFALYAHDVYRSEAPQREAARAMAAEKAQSLDQAINAVKLREDAQRDAAERAKGEAAERARAEVDERARTNAAERDAQVAARREQAQQAQQDQARREQAQREQMQRDLAQREQAQMQQAQQTKVPSMHSVKLEQKSTGQVLFLHVSGINAEDVAKKSIVVYYLENGYKLLQVF
jgi:hypothetical protein